MKLNHSLNTFMSVGTIFLSLNPGANNFAQDLPAQPRLTLTAIRTILPPAASPKAPKLADSSAAGEFYVCATRDGRVKYGRTEDGVALRTFYIELVPKAVSQSLCRDPLSENFVEIGHFQWELRQSVSTKIDDKVGNESFGTSSI
jgi:hypothetical protein